MGDARKPSFGNRGEFVIMEIYCKTHFGSLLPLDSSSLVYPLLPMDGSYELGQLSALLASNLHQVHLSGSYSNRY